MCWMVDNRREENRLVNRILFKKNYHISAKNSWSGSGLVVEVSRLPLFGSKRYCFRRRINYIIDFGIRYFDAVNSFCL